MFRVYIKIDILQENTVKLDIIIPDYSDNPNIICTWIGKTNKKAQKDYITQMKREDGFILWDDGHTDIAQANGYFAFIDGTLTFPQLKLYKIIKMYTKKERLKEWSNIGYTNIYTDTSHRRAFLCSNICIKEVKWITHCMDVGYSINYIPRGTCVIKIGNLLT